MADRATALSAGQATRRRMRRFALRPVQLYLVRHNARPACAACVVCSRHSRVAACWYSGTSFTVDVNLIDGVTHQVALYALDWESGGRSERVDAVDPANGSVLDSRTVSSFTGGQYLVYNVTGHVQFRITTVAGVNAVLSGLFFGGAPLPTPTPTPFPTLPEPAILLNNVNLTAMRSGLREHGAVASL